MINKIFLVSLISRTAATLFYEKKPSKFGNSAAHCFISFINHFFGFSIIVQKNPMIQVASCEQALIKTNRKLIQKHQSKTMLLFKTYTLEFDTSSTWLAIMECRVDLPVFLLGEFRTFDIFMQNDCFAKLEFFIFLQLEKIDYILIEYDHILPFTNHRTTLLPFWLIYKA